MNSSLSAQSSDAPWCSCPVSLKTDKKNKLLFQSLDMASCVGIDIYRHFHYFVSLFGNYLHTFRHHAGTSMTS